AHGAAAQDAVLIGHAGVAVAALARERADLARGDAAIRRAVVAVRAGARRAAIAAEHAGEIRLAAIEPRRNAAAAILTRAAAAIGARGAAAHVALGIAALRIAAAADGLAASDHAGARANRREAAALAVGHAGVAFDAA